MEETKLEIKNIEAFQQALQDYHVSERAKQVLDHTRFVVMSGLAGGGRNTIINRLVEQYDYIFIISDTTRPPKLRNGVLEQDGVHYHFRKEEDMLADIQKGDFIEAEIIHNQQVSGTSIRELERVAKTGKIPIHDFEFGGANNIAAAKPDADIIGLLPPSYQEWIRRFRDREVIQKQEFINRIITAQKVLENMLEKPYFKFVINDDIDTCVKDIRTIVEHDGYSDAMDRHGRETAKDILGHVQKALANPEEVFGTLEF
jgi:guanylate kinase